MHPNKFGFKFLFTIVLSGYCCFIFAQTKPNDLLNSWKTLSNTKTYRSDTASVILLNRISEFYLYNNADSAIYFAKQALQLAEYQKYEIGEALALNNISKNYYIKGDYSSSLTEAERLMQISNRLKYQRGIANAFQIMGLIYMTQNNYGQAKINLGKALTIFNNLKDTLKADKVYFNMGLCYDESGQPEKSFFYLNQALALATHVKDNTMVTMIHNRTGEAYFHLKKYNQALNYYQKVIGSPFSSNWEMDFAFSGLAQTYYATGDYQAAIVFGNKSLEISRKVNSASDVTRALEILSKSYAAVKDYANAYNYQVQFKKLNDSLFNSEKEKEVNYLHLKRQQVENIRLESNIKAKEAAITYSSRLLVYRNLIAVVVLLFIAIIIRSNMQKTTLNKVLKKQNEDIAQQKEEILNQKDELDLLNHNKDQLFSVISHDLRSPFAAILQTIEFIRAGEIDPAEQEIILASFHQQVSLVTIMVNNLLVWANSQQEGIKINEIALNMPDAVNEIVSLSKFLAKNKRIIIDHEYSHDILIRADLDHLKIIVQNLVGNAIKFTPAGGIIKIFYTEDQEYHAIHIADNGIGIPPEKMEKLFRVVGREISGYGTNNESGAGIGLVLIKQFVDANNGKLVIKSKPGGSEFTVYLKKVAVEARVSAIFHADVAS